ncbi:hypothetical protein B0H14DRAFT_2956249 [Mycena olivaceomarginata]|nr:hypothetical protein B0H14DRAFT_2956249 [Mycena olivaceomarginata]
MASRDKAAYGRFPTKYSQKSLRIPRKQIKISLCLASKRFHGICLPVLYRVVHLVHYAHAVHFCAGVVDNPTRGNFIREFSVDCLREPLRTRAHIPGRNWTSLLLESLTLMKMLLRFSTHGQYKSAFLRCTFPRLLCCEMSCAIDDTDSAESLATFLIPSSHIAGMRIPLLNLQWYAGPIGLLRSMDVGALREARIRCSTIHSKLESTIVALKLLTRPDIPFVFSHERREYLDFCARLVDTIRLPAVHGYLSLVIQRITASIRRFTRLEFLAIEYHTSQWMMHENMSIPLQALGNACPTLEACQLSDLAWRKVDGMWEDCSLEDFRLLAGLS